MKNRLIVPTDLSLAADQAIRQAVAIAEKAKWSLTLLHVADSQGKEEAATLLQRTADDIMASHSISCEVLITSGNVFEVIPYLVNEKDFDLMVIGTHGFIGLRQKLFGADILKLVSDIVIPVLVVQENSPVVYDFKTMVLPVSSHETFGLAVDAVLLFARIFGTEIHLYSIRKPGHEWTARMLRNIEEATKVFEERGVQMKRVREDQEGYSSGYALQTLRYARSIGADTMWMIPVPSSEFQHLAQAYKETMLLNEYNLPVLCAGGGKVL
jgi:nucleotide-binding universal stress UspA family protein